ncbi:hypothetical protein Droror1_Dr00020492 [Drosera rotundifolia]
MKMAALCGLGYRGQPETQPDSVASPMVCTCFLGDPSSRNYDRYGESHCKHNPVNESPTPSTPWMPSVTELDSRWRRRRATPVASLLNRENRAGNDTTSEWKTPGLVRRRHDSKMTTTALDESDDEGGNKNEDGGTVWIRVSGTSMR